MLLAPCNIAWCLFFLGIDSWEHWATLSIGFLRTWCVVHAIFGSRNTHKLLQLYARLHDVTKRHSLQWKVQSSASNSLFCHISQWAHYHLQNVGSKSSESSVLLTNFGILISRLISSATESKLSPEMKSTFSMNLNRLQCLAHYTESGLLFDSSELAIIDARNRHLELAILDSGRHWTHATWTTLLQSVSLHFFRLSFFPWSRIVLSLILRLQSLWAISSLATETNCPTKELSPQSLSLSWPFILRPWESYCPRNFIEAFH